MEKDTSYETLYNCDSRPFVVALIAVACGGGSSDPAATEAPPATAEEAPTTAPPVTEVEAPAVVETSPPTTAAPTTTTAPATTTTTEAPPLYDCDEPPYHIPGFGEAVEKVSLGEGAWIATIIAQGSGHFSATLEEVDSLEGRFSGFADGELLANAVIEGDQAFNYPVRVETGGEFRLAVDAEPDTVWEVIFSRFYCTDVTGLPLLGAGEAVVKVRLEAGSYTANITADGGGHFSAALEEVDSLSGRISGFSTGELLANAVLEDGQPPFAQPLDVSDGGEFLLSVDAEPGASWEVSIDPF